MAIDDHIIFPVSTRFCTGSRELDISEEVITVTGDGERGLEVLNKIHEKANWYMEKYGRSAKFMILDSQSYLDFFGYMRNSVRYQDASFGYQEVILHTSAGPLTPIVLPQTKRRIQVIGDDPMFTATQTLMEQQNR